MNALTKEQILEREKYQNFLYELNRKLHKDISDFLESSFLKPTECFNDIKYTRGFLDVRFNDNYTNIKLDVTFSTDYKTIWYIENKNVMLKVRQLLTQFLLCYPLTDNCNFIKICSLEDLHTYLNSNDSFADCVGKTIYHEQLKIYMDL